MKRFDAVNLLDALLSLQMFSKGERKKKEKRSASKHGSLRVSPLMWAFRKTHVRKVMFWHLNVKMLLISFQSCECRPHFSKLV